MDGIRVDSGMGGHPLRYRFGLLVAEAGGDPQEDEEAEIDRREQAPELALDEGQVGIRAEEFRDAFGGLTRADRAEQEERDGEDPERDLETAAAVADRLD